MNDHANAMRELLRAAGPIMDALLAEHKLGQHHLTPRSGCPSCVFGRGRKP